MGATFFGLGRTLKRGVVAELWWAEPFLNDDVDVVPDSNFRKQRQFPRNKEQNIRYKSCASMPNPQFDGTSCRLHSHSIILERTAGHEPLEQRLTQEDPRLDTFN